MSSPTLRVSIIGTDQVKDNSSKPYTAYRTVVLYGDTVYQRLIRYKDFRSFKKRAKSSKQLDVAFPKRQMSRRISLQENIVEERRVLLDRYMKEICQNDLSPTEKAELLELLDLPTEMKTKRQNSFLERKRSKSEGFNKTSRGNYQRQLTRQATSLSLKSPPKLSSHTEEVESDDGKMELN